MNHENDPDDEKFEARAQAVFADSVVRIDGRTCSRLSQARHAALDEVRPDRSIWRRTWLSLGGVTAAAVLAVWIAVDPFGGSVAVPESGAISLDDLDIVADSADLNLLRDVEFYAWVARQPTEDEPNNG